MKEMKAKRKGMKRGASVLIALLVFFLAALSGTVALTMATSNAGRYTHEKEDQQAYLSVASAAQLILDRLSRVKVKFECTKKTDGMYVQTPDSYEFIQSTILVNNDGNDIPANLDLFLADQTFIENLKYIAPIQLTSSSGDVKQNFQEIRFTLSLDGSSDAGSVMVRLITLQNQLQFQFWRQNGKGQDYQMTLTVDAEKNLSGDVSQQWTVPVDRTKPSYLYFSWDTTKAQFGFDPPAGSTEPAESTEGGAGA